MTREWVETANKKRREEAEALDKQIVSLIRDSVLLDEDDKKVVLEEYVKSKNIGVNLLQYGIRWKIFDKHKTEFANVAEKDKLLNKIDQFISSLNVDKYLYLKKYTYDRYIDSDPVEFDGDIIITDPCYIIRDDSDDSDWEKCDYGDDMAAIGITKFMTRDTIYGDWSCTTFNSDTKEAIGQFCADAGLVSVILLSEVLKYNPSFDYHINRPWTTTLVKDFKGTVKFVIVEETWTNDDGDHTDYAVQVVGNGVNKTTGEPINFVGKQTGF